MKHLEFDQIQAYLDDNLPEQEEQIKAHLDSCPRCRQEVRQYQALYTALGQSELTAAAAGFADRVMANLPAEAPQGFADRLWQYLPIPLAAAVSLVAALIWVDWSWLGKLVPEVDLAAQQQRLTGALELVTGAVHLDHGLLGLAVLVALLLVYLDRLLRQARRRTLQVW